MSKFQIPKTLHNVPSPGFSSSLINCLSKSSFIFHCSLRFCQFTVITRQCSFRGGPFKKDHSSIMVMSKRSSGYFLLQERFYKFNYFVAHYSSGRFIVSSKFQMVG